MIAALIYAYSREATSILVAIDNTQSEQTKTGNTSLEK